MKGISVVRWFPIAVLLIGGTNLLTAQTTYTFVEVRYPGADHTTLSGINNSGQIVGAWTIPDLFTPERGAFIREVDGSFITINAPKGFQIAPACISDAGVIGGSLSYDQGRRSHGFLRSRGGEITRFDYPGATETGVSGVNIHGVAVGVYGIDLGPPRAFMRTPDGRFTALDPRTQTGSPGKVRNTVASSINSKGEIAGSYETERGCQAAFIRSPEGRYRTLPFHCAPDELFDMNIGGVAMNDNSDIVVSYWRPLRSQSLVEYWSELISRDGTVSRILRKLSVYGAGVNGINTSGQIVGTYMQGEGSNEYHVGFIGRPNLNRP